MSKETKRFSPARERLHEVIFEADTREGKNFDIILMIAIVASVAVVMLESVPAYQERYGTLFLIAEWVFTVFFTIEYILRLYCVYKPIKYATSFFGIIDLVSILPAFLSIIFPGTHSLVVIRGLRLLRVFRIFKLASFMTQGQIIMRALKESRAKITVFVLFILLVVSIFGSIMYLVEGRHNPSFDSIPRSVYWAIVTLTTVGYGDISPVTPFGQFIAAFIMISGYAIIAVPTGIVTAEVINEANKEKKAAASVSTQSCRYCTKEGHDNDAKYCKYCSEPLHPENDFDKLEPH